MKLLKCAAAITAMVWMSAPIIAQDVTTFEREDAGNLVGVSPEDAAMKTAMEDARGTLPTFWKLYEAYPEYSSAFALKAGLLATDGTEEHIWIYDLSRDGTTITGKLQNVPYALGALDMHDVVSFETEQVSDWVIWSDSKRYGAFTIRVIADLVGGEQGAEMKSTVHPETIPPFADSADR